MKQVKYEDLTGEQQVLLKEAEEVMETAYNPYSKFYVGAALLSDNGIFTGSNFTIASGTVYGGTWWLKGWLKTSGGAFRASGDPSPLSIDGINPLFKQTLITDDILGGGML